MDLEFEYGLVDRARVRAVARFSSAKLPSSIKAVLWVRAVTGPDVTLAVTHSVARPCGVLIVQGCLDSVPEVRNFQGPTAFSGYWRHCCSSSTP
jgi:hypothetical protein